MTITTGIRRISLSISRAGLAASRSGSHWSPMACTPTRSATQSAIDLADRTAARIADTDGLELVRPSSLSIVLFRRVGWSEAQYLEWSEELLRQQIAFVTPTKWEGEMVARLAFLHPDTSDELVEQILGSMFA